MAKTFRKGRAAASGAKSPIAYESARISLQDGHEAEGGIARLIEVIALALAAIAPWAVYGVSPIFQALLYTGVFVLLSLWSARMLIEGRVILRMGPTTIALGALVAYCAFQQVSLPNLARLAPNTAQLYAEFLPSTPEVLPFGMPRKVPYVTPGTTISVDPGSTRVECTRLLAVFCLFVVVQSNFSPGSSLRRLSIMALVNGAALSLFGLVQYYSSPPDLLYWTWKSLGHDFFITTGRNHAPFYVNICIGLGVGVFLARAYSMTDEDASTGPLHALLRDGVRLATMFAVLLMVVAVFVCQSRGAFIALASGTVLFLIVHLTHARGRLIQAGAFLGFLVTLGLFLYGLEFDWTKSRVRKLFFGKATPLAEGRLFLWKELFGLVPEFPIWGTGLSTLGYVEALKRGDNPSTNVNRTHIFSGHAYNEFLEAQVEGGIVRLALTLLIVAFVARAGWRAYRRHAGSLRGGLILGALFALTTIVVHSWFDLGIHLPANAFMATLLAAVICLEDRVPRRAGTHPVDVTTSANRPRSPSWVQFPLVVVASVAVILPGVFLFQYSIRYLRTQQLLDSAQLIPGEEYSPETRLLHIQWLDEAAQLSPENAWVHLELGEANLQMFKESSDNLKQSVKLVGAAEIVMGFAARRGAASACLASAALADPGTVFADHQKALTRDYLGVALQEYVLARDLCPLLAPAHVRLAAFWDYLEEKEPHDRYQARAKRLLPADPEFWYYCGLQEIEKGDIPAGCRSWRHSLELADTYSQQILARSRTMVSTEKILEAILPDNADVIFQSTYDLFPKPGADPGSRPFLEKVLELMSQESKESWSARDWHRRAVVCAALGQWENACTSYEAALALEDRHPDWRLSLGQLLYEHGRLREARKQALLVLQARPNDGSARRLIERTFEEASDKGQ